MKPTVVDINVETGEQTVREMTDAEFEDYSERQDEARANSEQ